MSTSSVNTLFTAPGLGDRIHLVTIGYLYSLKIHDEVSLHLTGAQSHNRNRKSFTEILELFPKNSVNLIFHDFIPEDENDWSNFLINMDIDAPRFHYRDHLGRYEKVNGIDASSLLGELPCLETKINIEHKDLKYITVQWDSTASSRRISNSKKYHIEEKYKNLGYEVLIIGGEATSLELKNDLTFFNGVDFLVHVPYKYLVDSIVLTSVDSYGLADHMKSKVEALVTK